MNEQLKSLIELQEIDSVILSIAEKIDALPRKLEKFKAPLKEATAAHQKARTQLDTVSKNKKAKESELEEFQDKINKLKLRSKDVKTNKEYEAHLKEIEGFEKSKYKIEDDILALMESLEAFTRELQNEDVKVKKSDEEFKQQEKLLEDEKKTLYAEMETQKAKRKEFVVRIDGDLYEQYMNLLKKLEGPAVVRAKNEICLGCNTNIPPQLFNDIRKSENIFTCFYCKRFLYFIEPPSPPSDTKS